MSENQDILLSKWLQGTITENELDQLKQVYDLDELSQVLKKQKSLQLDLLPEDEMWTKIQSKTNKQSKATNKSKLNSKWLILLFFLSALIGFGLWKFFSGDILKTKFNEEKKYQFADASQVILGPESNLSFDESEWSNERKLKLKGQAYFDVESGNEFIVETQAGYIRVLGTQFDIWSPDNAFMRVQCYEGKVEVANNSGSKQTLSKGQELYIYNQNLSNTKSIGQNEPDWFSNVRNYRGIEIGLVLNDMKRYYAIDFDLQEVNDEDLFSGSLSTDNLDGFLKALNTTMGWEHQRKANTIQFEVVEN